MSIDDSKVLAPSGFFFSILKVAVVVITAFFRTDISPATNEEKYFLGVSKTIVFNTL